MVSVDEHDRLLLQRLKSMPQWVKDKSALGELIERMEIRLGEKPDLFEHACLQEGCNNIVQLDNQPFCDEHKIESITDYVGYSARKEFNKKLLEDFEDEVETKQEHKNIFDKD
jgi:hypothetical protein